MYNLNWPNSIVVMIVGMSIVFSFLIILILTMKLSHVIIHFFKWDIEPVTESASPQKSKKNIIAAISAAIKMYEKDNK